MSTLIKTRRMPIKYCVYTGGITEICYSATPEIIAVLPGTRWLEARREREARKAALEREKFAQQEENLISEISEPAAEIEVANESEIIPESPDVALEEVEPISWTDQMRIATTKLVQRQSPGLPSIRSQRTDLAFSTQD